MKYVKKIFDSIHGFIHVTDIEEKLLRSSPMKRLQNIHQLGMSYETFPGAKHTRFEHSLGTMHIASCVFDSLCLHNVLDEHLQEFSSEYKQLLRIGALLHDIGHLPFSHVAEQMILGDKGHEQYTEKLLWLDEIQSILVPIIQRCLLKNIDAMKVISVICLSRSEKRMLISTVCLLSEIISSDSFGADRIDYLLRDAHATGVNHGIFDSKMLVESLRIVKWQDNLHIATTYHGMYAAQSMLLSRYFMHKIVYKHLEIMRLHYHLSFVISAFYSSCEGWKDPKEYIKYDDTDIMCYIKKRQTQEHSKSVFDCSKRVEIVRIPKDECIKAPNANASFLVISEGHVETASVFSDLYIPTSDVNVEYLI